MFNGGSRLFPEFLRQLISLLDLHSDSLIFMDKFFQLRLDILLLKLESPLRFFELLESSHEVALLAQNSILFGQAPRIFHLGIRFLLFELGGVALENVVFGAYLMPFLVQILQLSVKFLQRIN